ncbi:MAG: YeeE/YedE family protein, partial [Alphaproteobacteria bacterium]
MQRRSNVKVVAVALVLGLVLTGFAFLEEQARGRDTGHIESALIGILAGLALYHASFGFTGAWRRFVREGRGRGLRAQMLLIGLICIVSYPLIAAGATRGVILPMGLASAVGAFMFGIGMQLGSGCASGTLFTAGGGSTRMMVVLAFFIAGSFWATYDWDFWAALPRTRAGISVIREFGLAGGLALL